MDKIEITGGCPLSGNVSIQGSKNAVLPMIAASIMTDEKVTLLNCPDIDDVKTMLKILESIGCKVVFENHKIEIDPSFISGYEILSEDAKCLRASFIFLGSLLGRFRMASIAHPGGCTIGKRPINIHVEMLEQLGVKFQDDEKEEILTAHVDSLNGANLHFYKKSVGASQNCILAAVLANGVTRIKGIALEPEVMELCSFLRKMGAIILRTDYNELMIKGVKKLHGVTYNVPSDRIVAGTYMMAAVATRGKIFLKDAPKSHLRNVIYNLEKIGAVIFSQKDGIIVDGTNASKGIEYISTENYPGFPTDLQSQLVSAVTVADSMSIIEEKIFEERFKVISQLEKMGSDIKIDGRKILVYPVRELHGAEVEASELRGGAALVIAGLIASGKTTISGCNYIKRGYEDIVGDFKGLGVASAKYLSSE